MSAVNVLVPNPTFCSIKILHVTEVNVHSRDRPALTLLDGIEEGNPALEIPQQVILDVLFPNSWRKNTEEDRLTQVHLVNQRPLNGDAAFHN